MCPEDDDQFFYRIKDNYEDGKILRRVVAIPRRIEVDNRITDGSTYTFDLTDVDWKGDVTGCNVSIEYNRHPPRFKRPEVIQENKYGIMPPKGLLKYNGGTSLE